MNLKDNTPITVEQLMTHTHAELTAMARSYGLDASGNKAAISQRIHDYVLAPAAGDTDEPSAEPTTPATSSSVIKYKLTPKNGVSVCGVPPEGIVVEEGDPLLRFPYYLHAERVG